jgi:protein O-GlcNAc transferase
MNLPVLTCIGNGFASRVAASLAYRINADALVTDEICDYTEKAIALAQNPAQLLNIKKGMKQYADECNVFNPAYFMQQLATQYQTIWQDYINS